MRRVILGVFAAAVFVVVLDQILKMVEKKSNFCPKMPSKLKFTSGLIRARQKLSRLELSVM